MNQDRLSSAAESVDKIGTRKRNGMSFLGFPRSHPAYQREVHLDSGLFLLKKSI